MRPPAHHPDPSRAIRRPGQAAPAARFYHFGQFYFYVSLRQPVELGHQTTHRYRIAKAAYEQQKWTVLQAELLAIVQTYRFFETAELPARAAAGSPESWPSSDDAPEDPRTPPRGQPGTAADVVMARVESRADAQLVDAAEQDYVTALTDLRNQIGIPESAGSAEPLGEFVLPPYIPPAREDEFIQMALESRPDIHAAQARSSMAPRPRRC